MSITIRWYSEARDIICYCFEGTWTWGELYPAVQKANHMALAQAHRVDVLVQYNCGLYIPKDIVSHVQNFADRRIDTQGITVITTDSRFLKPLVTLIGKVDQRLFEQMKFAESVDEALEIIEQDRSRQAS